MKKTLTFLLIGTFFIILLSAGFYFLQQKKTSLEFTELAELVSQDAMAYIYADNLNEVFGEITQTALAKNIIKSSPWKNFINSDKGKNEYKKALQIKDLVLSVLKKRYSIAFYSREKVEVDFLHLVELTPDSRFKEKILKIFLDKSGKTDIKSSKYKKFVINTVYLDNFNLYYTVAGSIALISNNQQLVKDALDLGSSRKDKSLADSNRVNNIRKKFNKTERFMWAWFDARKWQEVSQQALLKENKDNALDEQLINELKSPFSDVCLECVFDNGFEIRIISMVDKSLTSDDDQIKIYNLFADKISDKRLLNVFPKQSLALASVHIESVLDWYELFKDYLDTPLLKSPIMGSQDSFKISDFKNNVLDYCGIDLEKEVLSNIGKELSVGFIGFENFSMPGLNKMPGKVNLSIPLPQLLLAFEVREATKAKDTMKKLYNKVISDRNEQMFSHIQIPETEESDESAFKIPEFEIQERDYKGSTIYQVGINSPELQGKASLASLMMFPSFTVKNNDFLISFPSLSVDRALDDYDTKQNSIKDNRKISDLLDSDYTFMFFVDVNNIISSLEFILKVLPIHESISEVIDIIACIDFVASRMVNKSEYAESNLIIKLKK
ncbi:MAG: hypothetical protein P9L96_05485 [Candidatus Gygaella obscura]|nr:hypothetical protein [Candidatus Gygaella obscura]